MTRAEGWELRLVAAITAAQGWRWEWGVHDCCAFARACVMAVLDGPTPWDDVFTYASEAEAVATLDAGGGIPALLGRHAPRCPLGLAQRGDLATLISEEGPAGFTVGVVEGRWIWAAARRGLGRAPLAAGVSAWRIG